MEKLTRNPQILKSGCLEKDWSIYMNAKWDLTTKVNKVFSKFEVCYVILWNELIASFAKGGGDNKVFTGFERYE